MTRIEEIHQELVKYENDITIVQQQGDRYIKACQDKVNRIIDKIDELHIELGKLYLKETK
jgi:hypothetical protein